jgi:hypothetical protein
MVLLSKVGYSFGKGGHCKLIYSFLILLPYSSSNIRNCVLAKTEEQVSPFFTVHTRSCQTYRTSEPLMTIFRSSGASNWRELDGTDVLTFHLADFLCSIHSKKWDWLVIVFFLSASRTGGSKEPYDARAPHFGYIWYKDICICLSLRWRM